MKQVKISEVKRFMVDCLCAAGAKNEPASVLAEVLVAADLRGHFSHGLNRLEMYVRDIQKKVCDPNVKPTILKENVSTALVGGNNGLGPVIGNFCMDLAIKKANTSGIGWVVAKGSNHYGMAAYYSMQALKHGMMGLSFTNTSPLLSPTRSKTAALGTNPISFAAPGSNCDSFVLDMATTTTSVGKIEVYKRKQEKIPDVWAQDPDGNPTTDPELAFKTACLLPLGGTEETAGYKGYGLALMVETMCGISAGSRYGYNIRKWVGESSVANLGQCFAAIKVDNFEPGFEDRMSDLMDYLRCMEPAKSEKPVLVPGDPERTYEKEHKTEERICYHVNQFDHYETLASELKVMPMPSVSTAGEL